ncbi:MAG: hypothetical protein F6K36_28550 [Symploca sp. SIO3C6]|nr:hypothetical protein [Symploca sp. SIO3C6]
MRLKSLFISLTNSLISIAYTWRRSLLLGLLMPSAAVAEPIIYISDEVGFDSITSRTRVDTQDDNWRNGAINSGATNFTQNLIPAGTRESISATAYPLITTASGIAVEVSLRDLTNAELALPNSTGTVVTGNPRLDSSNTLQGSAPRPASLYNTSAQPRFWNELSGSLSSRNAILFTFSESVVAFGAWFGDLETRTDGNGTPAILRLLDTEGKRIGDDIIIPTSTLNQSNCSSSFRGCGNSTTRWIGFLDPEAEVKQMLLIVGDDNLGGDGYKEHISFIGATLAEKFTNLILVKRITAINGIELTEYVDDPNSSEDNDKYWPIPIDVESGISTYLRGVIDGGLVVPGDELEYTIYFLVNGSRGVTNLSICDLIPEYSTFVQTAFNGLAPVDSGGLPGADLGMALALDNSSLPIQPNVYLTNTDDRDRGQFFPAGITPSATCSASNEHGAVVVDVVTTPEILPQATAPGTPPNSYGFIRFRVRVK